MQKCFTQSLKHYCIIVSHKGDSDLCCLFLFIIYIYQIIGTSIDVVFNPRFKDRKRYV